LGDITGALTRERARSLQKQDSDQPTRTEINDKAIDVSTTYVSGAVWPVYQATANSPLSNVPKHLRNSVFPIVVAASQEWLSGTETANTCHKIRFE